MTECKRGIGGKNSPIHYIPKSDPIQEALEKKKKVTYFKLTLPSTKSNMRVAQWTSRTPEQFLLHVCTAIYTCKQMELDANFARAQDAVTTAELNLEMTRESYVMVCNSEKKGQREQKRSCTG